MIEDKLQRLEAELRGYGSCVVAYSGGVDSVFLSAMASRVLGDRMVAVIADSPSLPRRDLKEALDIASAVGFKAEVIKTGEFSNPSYLQNPSNRCYFCKQELFLQLVPFARERGYAVVAYGENASDVGDYRPGASAASESGVKAPLKAVGLTKVEIRQASAAMGLATAEKPEAACLSSRIPYGEVVTPAKLAIIEAAEAILREAGCREVRLRLHEVGNSLLGRIELGGHEMNAFINLPERAQVCARLRELGLLHVTLDLEGYRRGSLNEALRGRTGNGVSGAWGGNPRIPMAGPAVPTVPAATSPCGDLDEET